MTIKQELTFGLERPERFSVAAQEAPHELDEEAIVGDARTGVRGYGII
jgi:hypothetical protein